jgi:Concanavalin A-like lectin/glucanases superfamily/Lamin Tail Domain
VTPPISTCVLSFDGKSQYVEVPYKPEQNPDVFSVSAWVKVTGSQNTWRSVITSRDGSPNRGYIIYAGPNNKWQAWVGNGLSGDGNGWMAVVGSDVQLNTWTHVTSIFDGKALELLINGKSIAKKNVTYAKNTQRPLRIGTGLTERTYSNYFYQGQIAEVSVWNIVRPEADIQSSMNQRLRGDEAGLVGYWPLNECSGTTVADSTSNGNAGKVAGATWQTIEDLTLQPAAPDVVNVVITDLVYKGKVKRAQSDEYVEIANQGSSAADISGWKLTSAASDRQVFVFPAGTKLSVGQSIRVYTNEVHPETGGFSFGSRTAIWNDQGDLGTLFNAEGQQVSTYSYGAVADK